MALHEERSERRKWSLRIEQERQHLSASVEEALADTGTSEQEWQDDEQSFSRSTTSSGTPLVPPRLSLQSRTLQTVRPAGLMNATTSEHFATPRDGSTETERQSEAPGEGRAQGTSMLARLAQRFTSSIAAIGNPAKAAPAHQQRPITSSQGPTSSQDARPALPYDRVESDVTRERPDVPLVRVIDTAPPAHTVVEAPVRGQARSLKRNGKVRLETAVLPAIPKMPERRLEEQETGEELLTSEVREALDRQQVALARREEERLVAPLPILEMFEGELGVAARGSLSGSSAFETGQSDVTLSNTRVTASSVVQVMLTSNPGPVVVQYISLQPQVGFTVHLTAPVSTRTTFNYVILLGELF